VSGRVEEHSDIVLWLLGSDRGSECDGLRDRRIEVTDLEVEVHHRALLPVGRRPYGRAVIGRLLEHDIAGSLGSREDRRARLLVTDGPSEQPGIEPGQRAGVGCLNRGSSPHAFRSRLHLCPSAGASVSVSSAPYCGCCNPRVVIPPNAAHLAQHWDNRSRRIWDARRAATCNGANGARMSDYALGGEGTLMSRSGSRLGCRQ
jgi:hypothetical protein